MNSVKIVKADLSMKVDEDFKDQSIEDIAEGRSGIKIVAYGIELPENSPRYVLISHELVCPPPPFFHLIVWRLLIEQKHKDGRISYPLILINWYVLLAGPS